MAKPGVVDLAPWPATPDGWRTGDESEIGDRLVLEGTRVGDRRRQGVIVELRHPDGSPPYLMRWLEDGHEAVVFPGPDSKIAAAT